MKRNEGVLLVLRVLAVVLVFLLLVTAFIVANYQVSKEQSTYQSFFERLHPSFYIRTAIILFLSSLLYTPISYGISNYFVCSIHRKPKFSDIFFMFAKPKLFFKAVGLRMLIWLIRGVFQLTALFVGIVTEAVLVMIPLLSGNIEVLNMSVSELIHYLENTLPGGFMYFSVFLWLFILLMMLMLYVRFSFCKYALLRFEELTVIESFKIGLYATRGRLFKVLGYYIRYYSYYVLLFASLGLLNVFLKPFQEENFSSFAYNRVGSARNEYYFQKTRQSS